MASCNFIWPICSQTANVVYVNVEHQRIIKSSRPSLSEIDQPAITDQGVDPQPTELVTPSELREIENNVREAIKMAQKQHLVYWYMTEM